MGFETTSSEIIIPKNYQVFVKPTQRNMSQRKVERYKKVCDFLSYYRRNPVKFIEDILGAQLLDAQAYCLQNTWSTPNNLWVCSRGFGKSTLTDLLLMAKDMLFSNYIAYIASGSGSQSQGTFTTLERIAKKNIESMTGLTDYFKQEVEVKNATGDGFVHNPDGFYYTLYNGSMTKTLNSSIDKKRGARANLVVFDECGFLSEEMMNVYAAFTIVNKDFKMGGDVNIDTLKSLPKELANQLLYISSASSIDTPFYSKYRDFSKRMFMGDKNYFVADVNCDVVIHATKNGKIYPAALLSQDTVDMEKRVNPQKAMREYYNKFTDDAGDGAIIKRAWIARNSSIRPPVLFNDNNPDRRFVLAYDPARSNDNSILGVGEIKYDAKDGFTMDIVNIVSFADLNLKKKTPMMTQDQIKEIHKIILDYNGDFDDYQCIECFLADAGSGGGGNSWVADSMIEDWTDKSGKTHKGFIDKVYSAEYVKRYPNAIDKFKLIEPSKYKSEMYEATIRMIEQNLVSFPDVYDGKGFITTLETDEKLVMKTKREICENLDKLDLSPTEYEERLAEELSKIDSAKQKIIKLDPYEELSLRQIDAMKEEIVNICRYKKESGKDSFKLPAHKDADTGVSDNTLHDDRSYVTAMLCWYLSELRVAHIRNKKKPKKENIGSKLSGTMRSATRHKIF